MIAIGRVLTGHMPDSPYVEDFKTYTYVYLSEPYPLNPQLNPRSAIIPSLHVYRVLSRNSISRKKY